MRTSLIAGNWKMNGSRESSEHLLKAIRGRASEVGSVELLVMPPFVFLEQAQALLQNSQVAWGAQDVSSENNGAFTGEISASMLHDIGCRYVIVGHSERRALFAETNEKVALKLLAALNENLSPILCVGESLNEREAGKTLTVISRQIDAVISAVKGRDDVDKIVIAYEPVWAIGTGKIATPVQAEEVHAAIRSQWEQLDRETAKALRILYGGSVKPDNADIMFAMPNIDGALVGGASLDPDKFIEIALCATKNSPLASDML